MLWSIRVNYETVQIRNSSQQLTCTVGLKLKSRTDKTIVKSIAIEVAYTCKRIGNNLIMQVEKQKKEQSFNKEESKQNSK